MSTPKGKRRWLLWLGLAALLLIGGCWLLRSPAPKKQGPPPAVPVSAVPVRSGNLDVYLTELGTVTPIATVTVTSRVAGELKEIHYTEGQIVKPGDLLAVIDPRPYAAAVTQAQGQLAKDRSLLENAKRDLGRYQEAFRQQAIPQQQLATQQATVDGDAGTVMVDEGNLAAAQVNLDYTRITSPISGRVGLHLTDLGNIVAANGTSGIVSVTQLQPISVVFTLAEDDLGAVVQQMRGGAHLRVDALDRSQQTRLAQGELLTVDNAINLATGTVRAKASFANSHNELFPNQFVNVKLLLKTLTGADLVPTAAIQHNGDLSFVYVVQGGGTVASKDVKVVATDGDVAAVTGVNPGDTVVTDGFDKLQAGVRVSVRPATATPAPKAAAPASAPSAAASPAPATSAE
jgi:multidrug efflux system membrane fusion protein